MFDGDTPRALSDEELDEVEGRVTAWAERLHAELDVVDAVERGEPGERRWFSPRITPASSSMPDPYRGS